MSEGEPDFADIPGLGWHETNAVPFRPFPQAILLWDRYGFAVGVQLVLPAVLVKQGRKRLRGIVVESAFTSVMSE